MTYLLHNYIIVHRLKKIISFAMSKSSYNNKARSQLNLNNKREICEYAKRHPKAKHGEIANRFNINKKFNLSIDRSTASKILTKKEKWLDPPPSKQTSSTFRQ